MPRTLFSLISEASFGFNLQSILNRGSKHKVIQTLQLAPHAGRDVTGYIMYKKSKILKSK